MALTTSSKRVLFEDAAMRAALYRSCSRDGAGFGRAHNRRGEATDGGDTSSLKIPKT
jgi:hypothetical protein